MYVVDVVYKDAKHASIRKEVITIVYNRVYLLKLIIEESTISNLLKIS